MIEYIEIDTNSRRPKYLQLVESVTANVSTGRFKIDTKMPSISLLSEAFSISKDTVIRAYDILKERNTIISSVGKGHYVSKTKLTHKTKILFLMNKLSSYKLQVYDAFTKEIGANSQTDLQVYHCDESLFLSFIEKYKDVYDYLVIMSHFKSDDLRHVFAPESVLDVLKKIPEQKLVILDDLNLGMDGEIVEIYQDYRNDIFNTLTAALAKIKNYKNLVLVYPEKSIYPYPIEIVQGFTKFCTDNEMSYEIIDSVFEDISLKRGDLFITIEEDDLVTLVRQIREFEFELGNEIGVISYNNTPLKELLDISVISTDMQQLGATAAQMILSKKKGRLKNPFHFVDRGSI